MSTILEPQVLPADQYNQVLVENTHPPSWQNPKPAGRYNLVVIGAGTAGLVSAAGTAVLGAKVALVERHLMGGDCLNYGCVPSKALISAARAAYAVTDASKLGITSEMKQLNFADIMRRLRRVRAEISVHDSVQRFSNLGVEVFLGNAQFRSKHTVEVGGTELAFSKAIIATGARAARLPVPGFEEAGYLTNETVFSLTELPRRLVVIGAGPIGCELAQSFRRLGSEVTIITRGSTLLPREDSDAAAILREQFEREGIHIVLNAKLLGAEAAASGKRVLFDRGQGKKEVTGDDILVAVGRASNIEGLGLEAAGVKYDRTGVIVNDFLRTSNPSIYAAGDISSKYKFTHAAEALARIALQNALFYGRKRASELVIPWCTYTDPEIAHVGLNATEAAKRGIPIETFTARLDDNDRAIVDGHTEGFARIHVGKKTGKIVGATLVSSHAGESVGELVLAQQRSLKAADLSGIIHPYPTEAEIIKRLGDSSLKSRLKPWIQRMLVAFFKLRR